MKTCHKRKTAFKFKAVIDITALSSHAEGKYPLIKWIHIASPAILFALKMLGGKS